jgi:hypothetical protein
MGNGENLTNQGSPTLITFNNQLYLFYVDHNSSTIYVDVGLTGHPISTDIVVYSGGLTDVGAAVLNGNSMLLTYVAPNQTPRAALTPNGYTITSNVSINTSATGFNSLFVPTPIASGADVFVAVVGNSNLVYLYETWDGQNFGYLHQVSGFPTISRPAAASYNGSLWYAWTTSNREAVIGTDGNLQAVPGIYWGNSNHNGGYAGIALLSYNNILYAFGQDTASSQYIKYIYSIGGASWSGPIWPGNQMRWTPSLTLSGAVFLIYQDSDNTNMTYRTGN